MLFYYWFSGGGEDVFIICVFVGRGYGKVIGIGGKVGLVKDGRG